MDFCVTVSCWLSEGKGEQERSRGGTNPHQDEEKEKISGQRYVHVENVFLCIQPACMHPCRLCFQKHVLSENGSHLGSDYNLQVQAADNSLWSDYVPHDKKYTFALFASESAKSSPAKSPKKIKVEVYKLSQEQKSLIKNDKQNKKLWDEAMESLSLGPVRTSVYLELKAERL